MQNLIGFRASKNNEEDEPQENPPFRQIFATFPTIYLLVDFFRRRSAEQEDSDVLAEICKSDPRPFFITFQ